MKKVSGSPMIAQIGEKCKCGHVFDKAEGVLADKWTDAILKCKHCVGSD